MLNLITGSPGSGKTLYVVDLLKNETARTVYNDGVPVLKLPWIPINAHEWAAIPDGSILVVDECQRIWPVRDPKKPVPPDIQLFETHRHRGIDVYLMTQHPKMLDHHIRRLVGNHIHLRRNFGLPSSLLLQANEVIDDPQNPDASVQRSQFLFPSSSYDFYKSAEVHTHKFKPTFKMFAMLGLVIASIAVIGYAIYRLFFVGLIPDNNTEQSQAEAQHTAASDRPEARAAVPLPPPPPPSFLEQFIPESPVVPESAPLYRDKIEVKSIPHLSGCLTYLDIDQQEICNCYTQQGTRLELSYAECHAYIERPPFQYWRDSSISSPAKPSSVESLADSTQ